MKLDWSHWIYGLAAAVIGGGSGAVTAGLASMLLDPAKFNVTSWSGVARVVSMSGACFVINGLMAMFYFLKQSPVPREELTAGSQLNATNSVNTQNEK